jgi:PAS domain S-box-containing protein
VAAAAGAAASLAGLVTATIVSPYLDTYTVLPSVAAVLVSAWYGGLIAGLVATLVSLIGVNLLLVPPVHAFGAVATGDTIRLAFFVLIALGASYASESLRRTTRALRESEEHMRIFIDAVRDYAIFFLDSDGRIIRWTAGAQRAKGYGAEEVLGRSLSLFYPPGGAEDGTAETHLQEAEEYGEYVGEGHRVRKDGSTFWAHVTLTALRRDDQLVGFSKVTRDLSAWRSAERALSRANREIAATTYAIAHDLRSPLRAVDGYSYMLLTGHADRLDEEARGMLDSIRAAAQRTGALIDGLLSLARHGRRPLVPARVDLAVAARAAVSECVAAEPGRAIELRLGNDLHAVGDPELLATVVHNLIDNACRFTAQREAAVVEFDAADGVGERIFSVRDNGVGFDPSLASHLFQPFHRLHHESEFPGHGIGLATVRRIVERHGGRVWAEATRNQGATFLFALPAAPVPPDEGRDRGIPPEED